MSAKMLAMSVAEIAALVREGRMSLEYVAQRWGHDKAVAVRDELEGGGGGLGGGLAPPHSAPRRPPDPVQPGEIARPRI